MDHFFLLIACSEPYTQAVDSFAYGIVLFEVCTGMAPHLSLGMAPTRYAAAVALHALRPALPDSLPSG